MRIAVSGTEVESGTVTFSESGFGRRLKGQEESFTLVIPGYDFTDRFKPIYTQCVDALIFDDEITEEFHPPFTGATRYPEFDEFLSMAERQRMEMVNTYFVFDILRLYLHEDASDSAVQWYIQSIDSLRLEDGIFSLGGRLIRRQF